MPPKETIQLIHQFGGVASLAHPWLLKQREEVMEEVVRCGIDGMECFPPSHLAETGTTFYLDFAHKHDLIATSGSDYHGTKSPEVLPGNNIFPTEEKEKTIVYLKKHSILYSFCSYHSCAHLSVTLPSPNAPGSPSPLTRNHLYPQSRCKDHRFATSQTPLTIVQAPHSCTLQTLHRRSSHSCTSSSPTPRSRCRRPSRARWTLQIREYDEANSLDGSQDAI